MKERILEILKDGKEYTPWEIAMLLGYSWFGYSKGPGNVWTPLRELCNEGLVNKIKRPCQEHCYKING